MGNSRGINIAALTLTALSLAWLLWFFRTPHPDFDPRPHQALGQVMAEEALPLLGPKGRILLFVRDYQSFEVPAAQTQAESFCAALHAAGKTVAVTNLIKLDPLRSTGLTADAFLDAVRRAKTGDVVVLFLRPPELNAEQMQLAARQAGRVVALCTGSTPQQIPLREMLLQGVLHKAIVNQTWQKPAPQATASARQWFEAWYEVWSKEKIAAAASSP
ncbi:MAG: hypothetical protein N3J91_15575 [Verrucomicrobiae bacterium]|nr:hypothetical protein [Verrucomicrobiae bacterium]